MLDASNKNDINKMSKYGKTRGFLVAKRYHLPTYSNFFIVESEEDAQIIIETYKEQNHFYMRSDVKVGDIALNIGGQNGDRQTIFEYIRKIKQKSNELRSNGVALIYWNNGSFCPTYETDGSFYLDFRAKKDLIIDYVGRGWDGSFLSHGSVCHETYVIPWEDILFLNDSNRIQYRQKVVGQSEYEELRKLRIEELSRRGISKEIVEHSIPEKYRGIKNDYFRQVVNQVVIPMYDNKELQRYIKEYIPIVQIENEKVVVPEIILPERLRYRERRAYNEDR